MHASSTNQKQKLSLLKSRRSASRAPRPLEKLSRIQRRRLGILTVGIIAGLGFPALAYAAQQNLLHPGPTPQAQSASTHINIDTSSSPTQGEDFLSPDDQTVDKSQASPADDEPAATVVINGENVPLVNGSVSKQVPTSNDGNVDVQVMVDNSSTSSSVSSSSTSTEINIDSSSSTSAGNETSIDIRGSPRR